MAGDDELLALMRTIAAGDSSAAQARLRASPVLASMPVTRGGTRANAVDFFLTEVGAYIYVGDTALHVAALAYDTATARLLLRANANVRAKNRRGAEPLHAAVNGGPGALNWNPPRQAAMIELLLANGAEIDAVASGGVTPLHRAVRNRCAGAVRVLVAAGADPDRPNDNGSTARTLVLHTTGRGGTGTAEAKREQAAIVELLAAAPPR